jgi:hypothetical protein
MKGSLAERVAQSRESALGGSGIPEPSYAISTLAWVKGYTHSRVIRHPGYRLNRPELPHDHQVNRDKDSRCR